MGKRMRPKGPLGTAFHIQCAYSLQPIQDHWRGAFYNILSLHHTSFIQFQSHVKNNITQALAFKMQQLKFPPLRERRLAFIENDGNDKTISIPAPARGATRIRRGNTDCWTINFNSRPCARGDQPANGTPARRSYFNSRPCARGDIHSFCYPRALQYISIPAPARGATKAENDRFRDMCISSPAPARGATFPFPYSILLNNISIPAPARGATMGGKFWVMNEKFQFPPLREGRPGCGSP